MSLGISVYILHWRWQVSLSLQEVFIRTKESAFLSNQLSLSTSEKNCPWSSKRSFNLRSSVMNCSRIFSFLHQYMTSLGSRRSSLYLGLFFTKNLLKNLYLRSFTKMNLTSSQLVSSLQSVHHLKILHIIFLHSYYSNGE